MPNAYLSPDNACVKLVKGLIALGNDHPPMTVLGQIMATFPANPPIPLPVLKYVFGPLVVHAAQPTGPGHRGDIGWLTRDLIKQYRPRVDLERIEILTGERPDLVSPTELWMVMYNASHDAPLGYIKSQIYCWAVARSLTHMGSERMAELLRGQGGNMDRASDDDIFTGYLSDDYRHIASAIIEKVVRNSPISGANRRRARLALAPD